MRPESSRSRTVGRPGAAKRVLLACHRRVNSALDRLERRLPAREEVLAAHAPVFILGAPRSGTTLLYQLVCLAFEVGYLSNAHCRFWGAPSLAHSVLAKVLDLSGTDRFESIFGDTPRASSPAECGDFWYRFFPRGYEAASRRPSLTSKERRDFVVAVARLTRSYGQPVVFKNVMNVLRLREISRALPSARFLVTERELLANAHSLLYARHENLGRYDRWWSLPVPGFRKLASKPVERQVIEQVGRTYETIRAAERNVGEARFRWVRYERMCEDPKGTLRDVARFLRETGDSLETSGADIPNSFPVSGPRRTGVRIDEHVYRRLKESIDSGEAGWPESGRKE